MMNWVNATDQKPHFICGKNSTYEGHIFLVYCKGPISSGYYTAKYNKIEDKWYCNRDIIFDSRGEFVAHKELIDVKFWSRIISPVASGTDKSFAQRIKEIFDCSDRTKITEKLKEIFKH